MPAIGWPLGLLAAVTDRGPSPPETNQRHSDGLVYSWVLALKGYT